MHRHPRGFFGSLSVFPGGGVDDVDTGDLAQAVAPGFEEDHDHRVAALRELAEETGLAATPGAMVEAPTLRGQALFSELGARGLRLDIGSLILVSRWVTPEGAPRRFDTRFYLLETDETPEVTIDTDELVGYAWSRPSDALRRFEDGEWPMFTPTIAHLRWLARRSSIADAVASAAGADGRTTVAPVRLEDGSIVPILVPTEDE